jgi:hypothetical protein
VNGVHIQQIWIAGLVIGVLYDIESKYVFADDSFIDKHIIIVCICFIGIKIEWW